MLLLIASLAFATEPANVVGGEIAPEGAWPDAAAIGFTWGIGCTGTLIAPDLVLTAGHCAYGIRYVILGVVDYDDPDGERISVTEIHEYPDSQKTYDVAVLELEHPASVPYRPLLLDCMVDKYLHDGAQVAIVGWGAYDVNASRYDSMLRQATTTVGDADCSATSRGCQDTVSPNGELIAGGDGIDSCNGDSGGPLYLLGDDGQSWLVGVTSRAAYPSDNYCGDGGIYVRPDAIADWIESETGRTLDRPDCNDVPINHLPVPTAAGIEVMQGEVGKTRVRPHDPDASDAHAYTLLDEPVGDVVIEADGSVIYTAPATYSGEDDFVVVVTDNGSPPLSAEVVVEVTVLPTDVVDTDVPDDDVPDDESDGEVKLRAAGGCGCGTAAAPSWAALIGLAAIVARRRR